ncbi:MAG TPA: haloacid dehalogenase-like hydrolase [Gaiellaceae bacterium]|nr:haloacid dehalogenase-like hydrolase [Gaiellaceae bacterium]
MQLVLDWDGTCTVRDSLVAAIHDLGDPSIYDEEFGSYGEALAAEVRTLRVTAGEAAAWATRNVQLRAGLHELVDRHRPVIVSSGLPQLIRPVLQREGLAGLELRSNDAEVRVDGWRVIFREEGVCVVCGDRCKRRSLPAGRPLVFVGDGWSDRCASLACDRVFARAGLATYLDERGVTYEPYETFFDVAAALS